MKTHKDLEVWKNAITFVTQVYSITMAFPKEEKFGLTSQLRRASISIPSNIAEGYARKSKKETIQFLYIALASNSEIETQLIIAKNLDFLSQEKFQNLEHENNKVGKQLINLIKYLNQ